MKKVSIAVATALTALAPAAFAQTWNSEPSYNSRESRDYRYDQGREDRDYRYDQAREYRDRDRRDDFARVIESRPLYAASDARQECYNTRAGVYEEVRGENKTRIGKGAAIGAVAGGVIGHQVDTGGGTAVGALLGGLLGHQLERRNESNEQNDLDYSRCRVLGDASSTQQGYEVRYAYRGQEYVTQMNHDPGNRVRVDGSGQVLDAYR